MIQCRLNFKHSITSVQFSTLQFQAFYFALDMHREARAKDAVIVLQRKLDGRPRGKVDEKKKPEIEKWLEGIYNGKLFF